MSQLFISRMPKMRATPQLVSAPLNPIPIAEHFRRSHPACEHSRRQHIWVRKITQSKTKTLLNELNVSHSSQGSTLWPVGSLMRPAFTQWRPNFHAWSPNSTDAKLVQWMHQLRWGYVTARTRQQRKDFCFSLWHFCHMVQSKFSGLKKLDSRSF